MCRSAARCVCCVDGAATQSPPMKSLSLLLAVIAFVALSPAHGLSAESKTVRDFGALGDGKADDTAAIQKAVDSGIGGIVFPKGVYRLASTITIDLDKVGFTSLVADGTAKVVMAGTGPAFHFVGTHEGSAAPDSFKPNVWE